MPKTNLLVWIDLEMTGLSPENDTIIEIATLVTDSDLNIVAEGPVLAVHQSDSVLSAMDEWNTKHHGESGLLDRVRASSESLDSASEKTLTFLKEHTEKKSSPLCGNSIHQDRMFLRNYMPNLNEHFHYRNIDVSSIKELVRRWYSSENQAPKKKNIHRALDDIRESIEELKFYRKNVFR